MALWVDKYRPKSLDACDYHKPLSQQLKRMVAEGDFPHMMFYGPSGAGKKTRVMAVLRELYGPGVEKMKVENKIFKVGASKSTKVEMTIVSSNHHIELNPSDAGIHDRFIIQDLIKDIAQNRSSSLSAKGAFKVVVLNEVDKLTRNAQNSLRRTMEKYVAACRLVLVCNSTCKVIEPLQSRCLCIRVAAPSSDEIVSVLNNVAKKERFDLPPKLATRIADASGRNLRRAVLSLEATKVQQYPFHEDQPISVPDWEQFIRDIARLILEEQTPARLLLVRGKLYELLTHCIPAETILLKLTSELMQKLDSALKYEVTLVAAHYEHRLQMGNKAIFHLEAFVAKFMSIYKGFLVETLGVM